MINSKFFLKLFIVSIGLLPLSSTSAEPKSVDKSAVATALVKAINHKDAKKTMEHIADQLVVREQEWESAKDGTGFVLGKTTDTQLKSNKEIEAWLSSNLGKILVEGNEATKVTLDVLNNELSGVEKNWRNLDIYLFIRGMGDVEHIFVVGINQKGKIASIYYN